MIRSQLLLAIVLALSQLVSAAPSTTDADYAVVLKQAREAKKDLLVFCDGSNWSRSAAAVGKVLSSPAARAVFGDSVLWARYDQPELSADELNALAKNAAKANNEVKPDFTVWNIPAILLVDAQGFTFAVHEGLTPDQVIAALQEMKNQQANRVKRDAIWEQASKVAGPEKAKLLGRGLDLMPENTARQRKDIIEEMKKADPNDASGYVFKVTFDAAGFHEGTVMKMLGEKNSAGVIALVDSRLTNPALTIYQRQTLIAAKAQAWRSVEDMDKAVAEWRKIIDLAPESDMASGAKNYIRAHTEPVRLDQLKWYGWHNPPVWVPMVVDVSAVIKAPGSYDIEFKHSRGHTRFGEISLKQDGVVIASDPNPKEAGKLKLHVSTLQPSGKVELWVKARGTGWFDGAGEILVTAVK